MLTDLIETLRLTARLTGVFEVGAPFALKLERHAGVDVQLVMVSRGSAAVLTEGEAPRSLSAGDLLLFTGPGTLTLKDSVASRAAPLKLGTCARRSLAPFEGGGAGPKTTLAAVGLGLSSAPVGGLLTSLPPMLTMPAHGSSALHDAAQLFLSEASQPRPGGLALLSRLAEVLFIELLRREGERSGCAKGDLKALADPQLSRALGLMHGDPARDWTIEALGREVGLSRSAFAARFTARVGQAPLEYLARWRMTRAARLLVESTLPLGEIAAQVGYQSDAAFNKAFARVVGQPPGTYRRTQLRR